MPYATQQDLVDRFGEAELIQLTDPDGQAMVAGKVQIALADAAGTIDSYLKSRYALPLASVPRNLVRIACDLARFELYRSAAGGYPTEGVEKANEAALVWLKDVSRGTAHLGADAAGAPTPATGGAVHVSSAEPVFTPDVLDGFANPWGGKP